MIVDEAWGAHLPFHPDLPAWAMDAGADICVTSIHKMGSGLEQGSVFHLQGDLVARRRCWASRADLLGTTSPSVLIFAGLDGWRRQMALHGKELMASAMELAADVRGAVEEIDGMHVNDRDDFCGPETADDFDPLPGVIDLDGLGITGYQAADWLRENRGIDRASGRPPADRGADHPRRRPGDHRRAAVGAAGPGPGGAEPAEAPRVEVPEPGELRLEQAMLPRDAFFGPAEEVPVARAAGRIAAEMITPYPPGIPAVLPGERLTAPVLRYLRTGLDAGMYVPDPSDPALDTVRVVDERAA